jgi:hypothetical protein
MKKQLNTEGITMNWPAHPCSLAGKSGQDKSQCVVLPYQKNRLGKKTTGKRYAAQHTAGCTPA